MSLNKTSALIIHNPISGTQNPDVVKRKLINQLSDNFLLKYLRTDSQAHFKEILISKEFTKSEVILVCGGDGTINAAASAAIELDKDFGILPAGSGNGLAKSLGINSLDIGIKRIKAGNKEKIDCLNVNNNLSFNVSGIGFDAHVASLFEKVKKRGFWTYFRIILKEYKHRSHEIEIECNGSKHHGLFWLLSIANSNQWGNDVYINPKGSLTDGKFELIGMEKLHWFEVPKLMFYLLRHKINKHPRVHVYSAKDAVIRVKNAPLHIDGDYYGNIKEHVDVKVYSKKLIVFV